MYMNALIFTLIATHITIVCVTLYLHRCQSHRGIEMHPILSHFMRFWLWLTTGMTTKQWVAIHRKHHQVTDKPGDPHSPHVFGIKAVMTTGWKLYNDAAKDPAFIVSYGQGTPKDWIEKKVYTPFHGLGLLIMLAIDLALFGFWGFLVWGVQMVWIPFWAAGMINGLGHWWGYRNGDTKDFSTNISPIGIIVGGEELHNNHHLDPASPKFSRRWFELDMGWAYIKLFSALGLVKIKEL